MKLYSEFWRNMFVWRAVEGRKVYWITFATNAILGGLVYGFLNFHLWEYDGAIENPQQLLQFLLATLFAIAEFSSTARRLHDTNKSNWWILTGFIPLIGPVWLFILLVLPTRQGRWHAQLK